MSLKNKPRNKPSPPVSWTRIQIIGEKHLWSKRMLGMARWKQILRSTVRQNRLLQSPINKESFAYKNIILHLECNRIIGFVGGLRVALRGTNLEGVNLVLFGSQPCPVMEDDRNSTRIECKVPSRVRNHIFLGTVSSLQAFLYFPGLSRTRGRANGSPSAKSWLWDNLPRTPPRV